MDKWFKDILPDKDIYHNRGRDQMRKKGVRNSSACDSYNCNELNKSRFSFIFALNNKYKDRAKSAWYKKKKILIIQKKRQYLYIFTLRDCCLTSNGQFSALSCGEQDTFWWNDDDGVHFVLDQDT